MSLRKCSYLAVALAFALSAVVFTGCGSSSDSGSSGTLVGTWHSDMADVTIVISDDGTYKADIASDGCTEEGTWSSTGRAFTIVVGESDCEGTDPGDTEAVSYSFTTDEDSWPILLFTIEETEVEFYKALLAPPVLDSIYGSNGYFGWYPGVMDPGPALEAPSLLAAPPAGSSVAAFELRYDGTGNVYYEEFNCACKASGTFKDRGNVVEFNVDTVESEACGEGIAELMPEVGATRVHAFEFTGYFSFRIWQTVEPVGDFAPFYAEGPPCQGDE